MARLLLLGLLSAAAKAPKKPAVDYEGTTQEPENGQITDGEAEGLLGPVKAPQTPVKPTDLPLQDEVNEDVPKEPVVEGPGKKGVPKPLHKTKPSVVKPVPSKTPSGEKMTYYSSPVQFMQSAQPGIDYPNYSLDNMPQTSFSCDDHQYPGYYADVEAKCQVFHYCPIKIEGQITVGTPFLCPNYTCFDMKYLTCNWVYRVDCDKAPSLYEKINSRLYQTDLPLIDDEPEVYDHPKPSEDQQPSKPIKKPVKKSN